MTDREDDPGRLALFLLLIPVLAAGAAGAAEEADLYLQVARQEEAAGHRGLAETAYRQALRAEPARQEAALHLAALLYQDGRYPEALRVLRRTIEAGGYSPQAAPLLYLWAGVAAFHSGRGEDCEHYLAPLLEHPLHGAQARVYLAAQAAARGELDRAETVLAGVTGDTDWAREAREMREELARNREQAPGPVLSFLAGYDGNVPALADTLEKPSGPSPVAQLRANRLWWTGPGKNRCLRLALSCAYYPDLEDRNYLTLAAGYSALREGTVLGAEGAVTFENGGEMAYLLSACWGDGRNWQGEPSYRQKWLLEVGGKWYTPAALSADDCVWVRAQAARAVAGGSSSEYIAVQSSWARDAGRSYWGVTFGRQGPLWKDVGLVVEFSPRWYPWSGNGGDREEILMRVSLGQRARSRGTSFQWLLQYERNVTTGPGGDYDRLVLLVGVGFGGPGGE